MMPKKLKVFQTSVNPGGQYIQLGKENSLHVDLQKEFKEQHAGEGDDRII